MQCRCSHCSRAEGRGMLAVTDAGEAGRGALLELLKEALVGRHLLPSETVVEAQ
jgi:hypothetical protein